MQVLRIGCKCVYHSKCLREYLLYSNNTSNVNDIKCIQCNKQINDNYILTGNTNLAKQTRKFLTLIHKERKGFSATETSKLAFNKKQEEFNQLFKEKEKARQERILKEKQAKTKEEEEKKYNVSSLHSRQMNNTNNNRNRNRNNTRTTNDRNIIRNTSEMDDFDNNFDNLENGARESEHENEEKNNNISSNNSNSNNNNNNRNNVNVNVNVDGAHSSTSSRVSSQVRQTHHHNEAPSVVVDTMAAVPRTRHTHSHRNRGEQQLIDSGNISTTDRRGRSGIRTARLSRGSGNGRFSKIPKQKILTGLLILAVIAQFVFFYIMVFAGSSENDNTGASSSVGVAGSGGSAPGMSNQMEDILGAGRMAKLNLKNKILPN